MAKVDSSSIWGTRLSNMSCVICPMQYMRHTYTKQLSIAYLKLTFNWVSYILSGNPNSTSVTQEHITRLQTDSPTNLVTA